jgi:tRNA pseudouridine55 synthase
MIDGILNINKPVGMTSFDVVKKIRSISGNKKVGHTGTLDPIASGVLPICIGGATKFADYIMKSHKIYLAELKLGVNTDTYDREGTIIDTSEVKLDEKSVRDTILSFQGEMEQLPPMYSAIKINGKKLYDLARQGIEIERNKRKIIIYSIEIINIELPYVVFQVKCSKGTYIRSLCHDIGEKLNCGGIMWNLKRMAAGNFNISNSILLEDLQKDSISKYIIPVDKALEEYPKVIVEDRYLKHVLNGITIKDKEFIDKIQEGKIYRVYIHESKFIGIGSRVTFGFKMVKLFVRGN